MTQTFKKIDVSESIHCNNIFTTSINSLFETTGKLKCKEIECTNITITGSSTGGGSIGSGSIGSGSIGGGSSITVGSALKTSFNISSSVTYMLLNLAPIEYDLYASCRDQNLTLVISSLYNITNENQLKKFYIYIENINESSTDPFDPNINDIFLTLLGFGDNTPVYTEGFLFNQFEAQATNKVSKIINYNIGSASSHVIRPKKLLILEITPFIVNKYNINTGTNDNVIKVFMSKSILN